MADPRRVSFDVGPLRIAGQTRGARAFLDVVPHAAYVDVSGAGHMVAGDRNDPFTEAVVRFLADVDGRG